MKFTFPSVLFICVFYIILDENLIKTQSTNSTTGNFTSNVTPNGNNSLPPPVSQFPNQTQPPVQLPNGTQPPQGFQPQNNSQQPQGGQPQMGGFGDASKLPNPQPPQFGENDSFLTSDTPTCTSQVTNSAKACVQRMAPVLCNANSQDQINMVYSMENYNGTDRCGEPELIKTSGVQNFKSINSAQAKIAEKFSVAIRNSLSCLPPVMRDLTTDAQNSLTSSIKNILDSQGTLNMNLAKFQIGINTLLLKRRRLFNANVTNISNLCVINNAGNCAAWKWTEDEVLNATDFYISFATSWSSFVSVVSTEYNTIQNVLNTTSSCNNSTSPAPAPANSGSQVNGIPSNGSNQNPTPMGNSTVNSTKPGSRMLINSDEALSFMKSRYLQGTQPTGPTGSKG